MRNAAVALVAGAMGVLAGASGTQAAWPERTLTLVVPFAPGGITDVLARVTAERLQDKLKQTVIVENVVGAAGTIAAARVARAPADGYTLFMATAPQISIAPFTYNLSYDPIKDFAPISVIATSPFVITVGANIPATTATELIALAKAKPGSITYGSAGAGSLSHLAAASFAKGAGIEITHVPYKGLGPAFQDVVAGHIAMMAPTPVELRPFLGQGTLKPLVVMDTKRSAMVPGVPAIVEIMPGSKRVITWNGIVAPAKTPAEIIERLSNEIMAAEKEPAFLERLAKIGVDPIVQTPQEFASLIVEDTEFWRVVTRDLGMKPGQ